MDNYSHGGDVYSNKITLDYSINVNPLGTPKAIILAMQNAFESVSEYPDYKSRKLTATLAKFHNVDDSQVILGNGASELIYSIAKIDNFKTACVIEPTFSEYAKSFEVFGKTATHFLPKDSFNFVETDFENLPKTDVYFLCNPNNPTGAWRGKEFIETLLNHISVNEFLVVDECFIDFVENSQSAISLIEKYPNLIILRAFTKSFAIAGVRLGYLITSNVGILSEIKAKLPPWNISTMSQEGGVTAIEKCSDLSQMRQIVKVEREYLIENLRKFNFKVFESSTNFILFKCDFDLKTPLIKREILIRDASNFYSFSEFTYRICVKLHNDNVKLIENIKEIVECQQNQ